MSPRMQPDGKAKAVAPAEVSLSFTQEQGSKVDWDAFFNTVKEKANEYMGSPKRELLFRLNERLQGRDPGEPFNWRGLRA